jgi:hypothetical protein
MINTIFGAGAAGAKARAASRYGSSSGSDQMMQLLAAPASQHCLKELFPVLPGNIEILQKFSVVREVMKFILCFTK